MPFTVENHDTPPSQKRQIWNTTKSRLFFGKPPHQAGPNLLAKTLVSVQRKRFAYELFKIRCYKHKASLYYANIHYL